MRSDEIYDLDEPLPSLIMKAITLLKELEHKIYGLTDEQIKIKYVCGHCGDLARQLVDTLQDLYEINNMEVPTLRTKQIPVKNFGSHTYLVIDNYKTKDFASPEDAYLYVDIYGIHTYAEVEKIHSSKLFASSLEKYNFMVDTGEVEQNAMRGKAASLILNSVFLKNKKYFSPTVGGSRM